MNELLEFWKIKKPLINPSNRRQILDRVKDFLFAICLNVNKMHYLLNRLEQQSALHINNLKFVCNIFT